MNIAARNMEQLISEHGTLGRYYGQAQLRCSELVQAQAAEIESLRSQTIRLRAACIVRDTTLAWAQEQRSVLETANPGLPKWLVLAQHLYALLVRWRNQIRERPHWHEHKALEEQAVIDTLLSTERGQLGGQAGIDGQIENLANLEASLVAADLVICQTGCLSHNAYWRVQDHCNRTGKACVLVDQPDAVRIVRIHKPPTCSSTAGAACVDARAIP